LSDPLCKYSNAFAKVSTYHFSIPKCIKRVFGSPGPCCGAYHDAPQKANRSHASSALDHSAHYSYPTATPRSVYYAKPNSRRNIHRPLLGHNAYQVETDIMNNEKRKSALTIDTVQVQWCTERGNRDAMPLERMQSRPLIGRPLPLLMQLIATEIT
jgi:hypothetical protein